MNRNEAAAGDVIITEKLTALDNLEINKITEIINGEILKDLSRSIFIALSKKPGELH